LVVGGVTVGLVSTDLLTAGAGNVFDQLIALVVDAQDRVVHLDGDDLTGVAQSDLDALADDLGAAAAGHRALHPGRALVDQREVCRTRSSQLTYVRVGKYALDSQHG